MAADLKRQLRQNRAKLIPPPVVLEANMLQHQQPLPSAKASENVQAGLQGTRKLGHRRRVKPVFPFAIAEAARNLKQPPEFSGPTHAPAVSPISAETTELLPRDAVSSAGNRGYSAQDGEVNLVSYEAEWRSPTQQAFEAKPTQKLDKPPVLSGEQWNASGTSTVARPMAFQAPTDNEADPQPTDDVAPPQPRIEEVDPGTPRIDPQVPLADDGLAGKVRLPFEVIDYTEVVTLNVRRQRILVFPANLAKVVVTDPTVCDYNVYDPRQLGLMGLSQGTTDITLWFDDPRFKPVSYLVRVQPDPEVHKSWAEQFTILEQIIEQEFPDSSVRLVPRGTKLFVKGQAKDAQEAAEILRLIRNDSAINLTGTGQLQGVFGGTSAGPYPQEATGRRANAIQVVNRLRVPGVQQVALKIKLAELNRSAASTFGFDMSTDVTFDGGNVLLQSMLNAATGNAPAVLGNFSSSDISFGLHYLQERGVIRVLSEPTLVTRSGSPAQFHSGAELPIPTTVGVSGAAAVTTDFRAVGVIVSFLPTVIDKDMIRIQLAPEFSQVNTEIDVNGIPSLNTRSVVTNVDVREGQTFAIAGLLDDTTTAESAGDFPSIFSRIFGRRSVTRNETELLILVTPELMQPMEPEEVPPLPGFDVTEPTNREFFLEGRLEGRPTHEHRGTVWPILKRRYHSGGSEMIAGPFGHGT